MLVVHRFSLFLTLLEEVLSVINVDYTEKAHPLQCSRISFLEKKDVKSSCANRVIFTIVTAVTATSPARTRTSTQSTCAAPATPCLAATATTATTTPTTRAAAAASAASATSCASATTTAMGRKVRRRENTKMC